MNETTLDHLSARSYGYLLMQRLFGTEPTAELLGAMDLDIAADAFRLIAAAQQEGKQANDLSAASEAILEHLAQATRDPHAREAMESDYTRCFVGPAKLPAPPFESVYANRRRIIMTETTLDVRRTYQASGFQPMLCHHVPDDHIALELDFMAALASRALECLAKGNEATADEYLKTSLSFLERHLSTWSPKFAAAMCENSDSKAYNAAAQCLAAFVEADLEWLRSLSLPAARETSGETGADNARIEA